MKRLESKLRRNKSVVFDRKTGKIIRKGFAVATRGYAINNVTPEKVYDQIGVDGYVLVTSGGTMYFVVLYDDIDKAIDIAMQNRTFVFDVVTHSLYRMSVVDSIYTGKIVNKEISEYVDNVKMMVSLNRSYPFIVFIIAILILTLFLL